MTPIDRLRTPAKRAHGLGSAHHGTGHWIAVRAGSALLVPLTLWLVASLVSLAGESHATVLAWVQSPSVAVALLLFTVLTFHHTALGLQVVIEDYVPQGPIRTLALLVNSGVFLILGAIASFALLRAAL